MSSISNRIKGVHYDFIEAGTFLEENEDLCIKNPQFAFVYCAPNEKHDDAYIGIRVTGYRKGIEVTKMMHAGRNFTEKDLNTIFKVTEDSEGRKHYTAKVYPSVVYGSVSYADKDLNLYDTPDDWTFKWGSAILIGKDDEETVITLSGDPRVYNPKDAEA